MAVKISDAETLVLLRELAARTGTDEHEAIEAAVRKALAVLDTSGDSYRERRNARVRVKMLRAIAEQAIADGAVAPRV